MSDKTSATKKRKTPDQSAPPDDKVPDDQRATDPQPCTMIPFDVHGWKTLQFDEGKLELGERVSHYINDKWQIGKISNLSYRGSKWAEYEDMPLVKSHKKGKRYIYAPIICNSPDTQKFIIRNRKWVNEC